MAVTKSKSKSKKNNNEPAAKRPRVVDEVSEESEEPLNLQVDEDGRVGDTNGPLTKSISFDPPARVYDDFVSAGSVATLRECCEKCFPAKSSKEKYSCCGPFWSDWGQSARCDLEALALAILRQHCPEPAAAAGVEWLILCMDSDIDEDWHFERDEELEDNGLNIHPMLCTITYLTAATSPPHASTIALDILSPIDRDGADPVSILGGTADCIVVPPKPGRHFVFDGRFLQGSPLGTQDLPDGKRISFVANIWVGHKPNSASSLPEDMQVWSKPDLGSECAKSIISTVPELVKPVESLAAPAKDYSFESGSLRIALPSPPSPGAETSVSSSLAAASWTRKKKGKAEGANDVDVIIVGAGACGVGVGNMLLTQFGISRDRMLLLERGTQVGTSFRLWPKEMRFISPSFNQQGWTNSFDLNSIAVGTSPASFSKAEHPSGEQYANYLERVARDASLPIRFGVDVKKILPVGSARQPQFEVHVQSCTSSATPLTNILRCRFVIWAAGEFQYPKRSCGFPGGELCRHNSTVQSWAAHPGEDFIVIGGYESGIDTAVNLANRGVTILGSSPCWDEASCDPSAELAPHTRGRLKQVMASEYSSKLKLVGGARVTKVEKDSDKYLVHAKISVPQQGDAEQTDAVDEHNQQEAVYVTSSPPLLCVGFENSIANLVKDLFDWEHGDTNDGPCLTDGSGEQKASSGSAGSPKLTLEDESIKTQGLFLVGPQVSHEGLVFCFVYKYRQRFAVVAAAVAKRLGKDTRQAVSECRSADMFLDEFANIHACCGDQNDDDASAAVTTRKLEKKKNEKKPAASTKAKVVPTLKKKPAGAVKAPKKLTKKPAGSTTKR